MNSSFALASVNRLLFLKSNRNLWLLQSSYHKGMNTVRGLIGFIMIVFAAVGLGQNVAYRTIASGTNAAEKQQRMFHITDQGALENYLKVAQSNSRPKVDFFKDRVVAIFLGPRPTGGYAASVRSVSVVANVATIEVTEATPAKGDITTQALTSPWVMIAIDRSVLDFKLNVTKVQQDGGILVGPYTVWYPGYWSPCMDGYYDGFYNPFGQVFYTQDTFNYWVQQSGFSFNSPGLSFNFQTSALAIVSLGRFSQGYSCAVESVVYNQGAAKVLVRRTTSQQQQRGARWFGVGVDRSARSIATEYFDDSSVVLAYQGGAMMQPASVGLILSASQIRTMQNTVTIKGFSPNTESLAAVTVSPQGRRGYKFEGVSYRGNQAVALFSRPTTTPDSKSETYLIRVPRGIGSIIVEDLPAKRATR
jgi:hypothetical protein